uniref:Uncharacterized protein n=1 Tax=Tanacetum cinerariifolium TaxID=118510 RepID=A0A699HYN0_TANCI|nr:hypothetical protein [Tanacetum cinerariifolium]
MKDKLSAHQETISILSQQKEAQIKLYQTQEDKKLEKYIELENKVKVLDNIVYKTGQSVQTMNMLNNKCRTSFVKPEILKKAKRANPRLYDIGCYNDNLTLMLSPESDEIHNEDLHNAHNNNIVVAKTMYNLSPYDSVRVDRRSLVFHCRNWDFDHRQTRFPNLQCYNGSIPTILRTLTPLATK